MSTSGSRSGVVLELAEEFLERYRRGQRPSLKEYIDRHPALADEIREVFPAMAMMENIALADESLAGAPTGPAPRPMAVAIPLEHLGDYRILREIGRGGMGVVYEAKQLSLGRQVALKILPQHVARDAMMLERFRREARAAARLHHTNIVPVFEVGRDGDLCYYAMQFIRGQGLDLVYEELRRLRGRAKTGRGGDADGVAQSTTHAAPAASVSGIEYQVVDRPPFTNAPTAGDPAISKVTHALLTGRFASEEPQFARPPAADTLLGPSNDGCATEGEVPAGATEPPMTGQSRASSSAAPPASPDSAVLPGGTSISGAGLHVSHYHHSIAQIGSQLAQGLAYAHARGVIHRDIKPSNLLLDTAGVAWITDFGLAKADDEGLTQSGDLLGTLRYMAPERFRGEGDARADVYALGLTLYELITLEPAFEAGDRLQLIEQVKSAEPVKPRLIDKRIPRDLETIVLKAIDKDPKRRYPTADAMAEDLRRFLDDEPILARRTSAVERYGRWARRNPWVAVLGGLLTAVLLAATGVSLVVAGRMAALAVKERQAARAADQATIQAESRRIEADEQRRAADASRAESLAQSRAARANFERARTAVDDFFTKVSESKLLSVPGLQSLRAELLGSALGFYGELVQERADDPSLRRDLLLSRFRAGRVLHELGRDAEARAILRTAIAGYEQELREHPVDPDLKAGFAAVTFLSSSIDPVAEQKTTGFERAIALREEVLKARSNDASNKFELAETYNALANDRHHRGDRDALSAYERSLMLKLELAAASPDDPGIIRGLGAAFNNLANEFASDNTRGQALAMYEQASELNREAIRLRPSDTTMAHKLYVGTSNLCSTLSELHRVDELVAAWRSTIATLRSMAHANPDVPDVHAAHFQAVLALADALLGPNASGADEAVRTLLDARDALEQMPRATAEDLASSARQRVAFAQKLGAIKTKLSRDEALVRDDQLDRAVQTFRQAIAAGWRGVDEIRVAFALKARPGYASLLAEAEAADALPAKSPHQGAMAAGAPSARASGAASRSTLDLRRSRAIALGAIGRARFKEGQIEEGQAALGRSLAIFKAIRRERPDDPLTLADLVAAQVAIGQVLWEAGKLREGANEWRAARSTLAAFPRHAVQKSAATDAALESWQTMARTYAQHGLCQEAAELFEEAVPLARDTLRQRVALDLYDFNAACMRLHSGDVDAYRRMCAELVEHYGNLDDSWVRMLLAWVTAIHPQSGVDPARRTNWAAAAESALRGHYLWQLAKQVHGMALYRAGRWAEAIAKIRESEQIYPEWPSQPSNWCLRAMAAFQMGQTREAQFLLRRVEAAVARLRAPLRDPADLTILPSNPSLDRQRWRHAIVWHEWLPLELLYAEASRLINGTPPAHLAEDRIVRGVVYARLGDAARAEADLRAAVEQAPDAPSVWLTRSHAFRLLGRTGEAESDLERAFRLPGGVCETWTDEYRWLVERGESATARRVLDRIVSVEPTTAISWSQRALVLVAAGRIGAARRDLVQAAKMTADSSDIAAVDRVVIECIQLPVLERRWVDALALVRAVNPLSRTGPMGAVEVFLERIEANLLILTGDRAGFDRYARATLKRAQAEPGPTFPGELAWICALSPNAAVDTAIMLRLADEAVSKRPIDDVWWRLALSCCLVRAGRYESALNTLDDVVRIDPGWDLATNDIVRALAHHHLGHDAEARHWLAIATRKMVTSSATGLDWPLWVRTNLHDALAHEALYHEAVTLILDPAFPVDPFRCAPRD